MQKSTAELYGFKTSFLFQLHRFDAAEESRPFGFLVRREIEIVIPDFACAVEGAAGMDACGAFGHGEVDFKKLPSVSAFAGFVEDQNTVLQRKTESQLTQSPPTALTPCALRQTPDTEAGTRLSDAQTCKRPTPMTPASPA